MNATVAPSEERSPRKTVAPGSPGSPRKGGARDKSAQPVVLDVSLRTVEPQEPLFLEENMVRRNLAALDTLFVSPSRRLPWRGAACGGALLAWRHLNCRPCLRGPALLQAPCGPLGFAFAAAGGVVNAYPRPVWRAVGERSVRVVQFRRVRNLAWERAGGVFSFSDSLRPRSASPPSTTPSAWTRWMLASWRARSSLYAALSFECARCFAYG